MYNIYLSAALHGFSFDVGVAWYIKRATCVGRDRHTYVRCSATTALDCPFVCRRDGLSHSTLPRSTDHDGYVISPAAAIPSAIRRLSALCGPLVFHWNKTRSSIDEQAEASSVATSGAGGLARRRSMFIGRRRVMTRMMLRRHLDAKL